MLSKNHHLSFTFLLILLVNTGISWAQNEVPRFEQVECPFQTDEPLEGVECGELVVYENREEPSEGTLRLAVSILKSFSENPEPDPLVFIPGGPGNRSVMYTPRRASGKLWNKVRENRDVIFYDQRGTGYSDPEFCPELNEVFANTLFQGLSADEIQNRRVSAVSKCYKTVQERGIDLSRYNTATSARDLDDLRQMLGYEEWNLLGLSYGSRLALTAMRDHPVGIRSVILDSPAPLNTRQWINASWKLNRSLNLVFEQCAADPNCSDAFPILEGDFYALVETLQNQPHEIGKDNKTLFPNGKLVINDYLFIAAAFRGLYNKNFIPIFPLLITETQKGNKHVWRELSNRMIRDPNLTDNGLQISVNCFEIAPFNPPALVDSANNAYPGLSPFYNTYSHHKICNVWHNYRADSLEFQPVHSNIPTLIAAGEFDPITPPENGQIAAKTLSNSTVIEVPAHGHGALPTTECTRKLIAVFLNNPNQPLNTSCVDSLPKVSFVTDLHINKGISTFAQKIQQGTYIAGLGLISLFLVSGILFWPSAFLIHRFRNNVKEMNGFQVSARWISALASTGAIIFLAGLAMAIGKTASQNPMILAFGLPQSYSWLFWLPWIVAFLTAGSVFMTFQSWKRDWWNTKHRIHYTLIAIALISLVAFISMWELW